MTDREAAARDWLMRNEWRREEIHSMELQLIEMREAVNATVKPPNEVNVQTQPRNVQADKIADIVDFEERIQQKRDYYNQLEAKTIETIGKVDTSKEIILLYRYVYHREWKYIAHRLHYSLPYLYEMHRKALNAIYPYIDFTED